MRTVIFVVACVIVLVGIVWVVSLEGCGKTQLEAKYFYDSRSDACVAIDSTIAHQPISWTVSCAKVKGFLSPQALQGLAKVRGEGWDKAPPECQ